MGVRFAGDVPHSACVVGAFWKVVKIAEDASMQFGNIHIYCVVRAKENGWLVQGDPVVVHDPQETRDTSFPRCVACRRFLVKTEKCNPCFWREMIQEGPPIFQ
jgi:hypothetical protein